MPFIVIKGTYRLCGGSPSHPTGFEPDGDSMEFRPDDPDLLDRLERVGRPCRLSSIGSTQLRFDGIDALELHYGGTHQPRPLADHVHGPRNDVYVVGGDGLDDVIEDADPRPRRDFRPFAFSVEDFVAVKFHVSRQAVRTGRRESDAIEVRGQRHRGRPVDEKRRHGEPVACVRLIHMGQQHEGSIGWAAAG